MLVLTSVYTPLLPPLTTVCQSKMQTASQHWIMACRIAISQNNGHFWHLLTVPTLVGPRVSLMATWQFCFYRRGMRTWTYISSDTHPLSSLGIPLAMSILTNEKFVATGDAIAAIIFFWGGVKYYKLNVLILRLYASSWYVSTFAIGQIELNASLKLHQPCPGNKVALNLYLPC